jgi:acetyltransferase-like isoleucine patch superfamily enzyme/glycosyltransferase involved in cell wall biosynthesis
MTPNVSWLLPIKNGMPFLPETLASLVAQTYQDFQVLVWDNGSTDGTIEELKKWIPERLPGWIVTGQSRSLGGSLAGLVEMAETELCARIDADDVCQPNRLEQQISFLLSHPEIALVGSQLQIIDEKNRPTGDTFHYPLAHEDIVNTLLASNSIGHPSVMFRRSAVLAAGNYDSETVLEDYDLWLRLAQNHKMANLTDCLVNYRMHTQSYTRLIEKAQRMKALLDLTFVKHASKLFGLTAHRAEQLRHHKEFFGLGSAVKIARHLSRTQGGSTWSRLRNPSLIRSLFSMTRSYQILSRFRLTGFKRKGALIKQKSRFWLKQIAMKFPIGFFLIEDIRGYFVHRRSRLWALAQRKQGCTIHKSVHFIGQANGYQNVQTGFGLCIEPDVTIWISTDNGARPQLNFGKNVYVGRHTYLGVYLPITIGDNTIIGAYSYVISANHRYESREIPIWKQGFKGAPIIIGEDVWIGTHVVILPGVTIGKGSIIAAGSLVNRSVPEYEIWGGVPARFIKPRP